MPWIISGCFACGMGGLAFDFMPTGWDDVNGSPLRNDDRSKFNKVSRSYCGVIWLKTNC